MIFLLMLAVAVPAYVLGSLNGAIIASFGIYRKDIRKYGSGNPGLTNFYRVFGKGGAVAVVLIDVAKTVVPVLLGGYIFGRFSGVDEVFFGRIFAGFFVVLGHCFPVFYGFRGGKGVMAIGTILIAVDWRMALIAWGVFILIVATTRLVSLGSMLGAVAFPVVQVIWNIGGAEELICSCLCALLLIIRHKDNILRLLKGKESKFSFKRNKEPEA